MHEHGDMNLIGEVAQIYKDMLDTEDPTVSVTVTTRCLWMMSCGIRFAAGQRIISNHPSILSSVLIPRFWVALL